MFYRIEDHNSHSKGPISMQKNPQVQTKEIDFFNFLFGAKIQ